jgi:phosphodiesterase/alkaline phosphatase D-like protein
MEGELDGSMSGRMALTGGAVVPWRAIVAVALLSLAVGVALWQGLAGERSTGAPAARFRVSSRLRSHPASQKQGLSSLPLGAQGPISDSLGAEDPAYRVRAAGGGLAAASPTQHFRARFDRSGVSLSSGTARVALSLPAVGYGTSLGAAGAVTPRMHANRVLYQGQGVSEWYANGPIGLDQGFTVARPPSARRSGALTLSMALSGNTQASLARSGQSIVLSRGGRPALRYGGLSATDAKGRALPSRLELQAGRILLRVDTAGAQYPVRIDPIIQQGEKLTGSGERGEEGAFGYSVALSVEGTTTTALIGAPDDNGDVGAAWVFTRSGGTWTQQGAKLTGKEEAGAGEFGKSVALSVEGTTTTALVGGPADNNKIGAAWVFTRSSGTWSAQGAKLSGSGETGAGEFGTSVALSVLSTTTTALIGGPGDNSMVGAAWVFTRSGTTWAAQGAKLTGASETGTGEFGKSVALAVEGTTTTALMGGPGDNAGVGAAWVFTRATTTWAAQGAKLTGAGETGAGEFGTSVALSVLSSTATALIGGPGDNSAIGAAWVFTRSGTTWSAQGAKLTGTGETGAGEFAKSVALSVEGTTTTALMGGPGDNNSVGAAWVFTRASTTWAAQGAKLTGSAETGVGEFGRSVALSVEGTTTTALMGGPEDNGGVGASWVDTRSGTTWSQQGEKLIAKSGEEFGEGEVGGRGEFGFSVALSVEGTTTTALIGAAGDNTNVGAAWVFTRSGGTWTQQGTKLTGKEEAGAGEFGKSVALSVEGTTTTALIGGPGDNSGIGAAWVFTRSGGVWSAQGAKLTGSAETGAGEFGRSVALSVLSTTTTALIGGPTDNTNIGAAWAFTRSGTTWTQQGAKLTGSGETGAGEFAKSVALLVEGTTTTALMGGPADNTNVGAAWVFTRATTTWAAQGAKLTGAGETGEGEFGSSVALSLLSSTATALIGGPGDNAKVGAAWVFTRSGTTWAAQGAKLTGSGETGAGEFAKSVALQIEGTTTTALMGGPADNGGIGAAWVFTRASTTWSAQGTKLTGSGETGAGEFGRSVALSLEGTTVTALMGGYHDNSGVGASWVDTRSGTTWTQQGEKLTAKSGEEIGLGESAGGKGNFGYSVAISSEGNTALIGGFGYKGQTGAAWVFTRSGTTWTQQGMKLTGGGETGSGEFGDSVALSSNGNTALIAGFRDNAATGAVWVFTRSGTTWSQQGAKLTASSGEETSGGEFGRSVALSSEGNTALIGEPGDSFGFSSRHGGAWVFTRSGSTWTQQGPKLANPTGEIGNGEVGTSVALSSEGTTALIGGPGDNGNAGAVWTFTRSGSTWTQQGEKLTAKEEIGEGQFGFSVALSSAGSTAVIGGPGDNTDVGAAWVFTRAGTTWSQLGEKLTAKEEIGAGQFGYGVALSSNGNMALIGGPADNTNIGAAWAFTHAGATWTQLGAKLTGSGEVGESEFGFSVALSSEGNTALIGGDSDNKDIGATWVFVNTAPTVETRATTAIAQTTATLNGAVNPDGGEVSECKFEYGTTTAYGSSAPCTPAKPGSGSAPVGVSAEIASLTANTTYHFRISAANAGGTSKGADETFKTLVSTPTVVTKAASTITQTSATLNATVNPNGGEVTACEVEYGPTTSYGSHAECSEFPGSGTSPVAVSAEIGGLTVNSTYHFRISATNSSGTSKGSDETFKTLSTAPSVVACAPSVTQTTAKLCGIVNPNGGNVTECKFEYGTTTSYGSTAACSTLPGSGTSPVEVSAEVTGLTANTTYHFRVSATNAGGTTKGVDDPFTTLPNPPTVVTKAASSITALSAVLNATVNPNGREVSECKFEYGPTTSYGSSVPCSSLPGSGTSPVAVSAEITGLVAVTAVHFRISATNPGGTSKGSDETLITLANPPTVVTKAASSITQTSATVNATVNPNGLEVTECKFEYGPTNTYGTTVPCTPAKPGAGTSPVAVSAEIAGLTLNSIYHFRISATSLSGTSKGSDETFKTSSNPPVVVTKAASSVAQSSAILNATVNPNGGEVSQCKFEYGTTTSYGSSVSCSSLPGSGSSPVAVSASVGSLAANTTYHFRISATNSGGTTVGADETFKTLAGAPSVVTEKATNVTLTSVTLNATVNPNGGEVTECKFEWGETKAYGNSVPCSALPGSGSSPVAVSASLAGLERNAVFHFRISATNAGGTSKGADQKFITDPPTVVTEAASPVTQTTATLNATVNPNGEEVSECKFEWGTTTAYGSIAPCSALPGAGEQPVGVAASLTGLTASTTYHFRITATNPSGPTSGADETFKTLQPCTAEGFCASIAAPSNIEGSFKEPEAVAVDPSGNIFVADSGHDRVLEFNSKREYLRQFGSEGSGEGQFQGIAGIAANSAGDVYVTGSDRVQEFSPAGALIRKFGSPGSGNGQFAGPSGIAIDSSGNVWVLDSFNYRVQEFSATGEFLSKFGSQGTGNGQLGWAHGLAFSGANLYVSEFANNRVQEFSTAGAFIAAFGTAGSGNGQFHAPWGIASDPTTGNLYVADLANNRIQEFSSTGTFIAAVGSEGSGAGQLSGARGVAVGSTGNLFIADTGNNRIEEWTAAKVAGQPPTFATSFTPANIEGSFKEPEAVAVDASGNIFVADSGHNRVLEFNSKREYLRQFGSTGRGEGQFEGIAGIAANSSGDVYVTGSNRVQEFSPTGAFIRQFGSFGSGFGQLDGPSGIAIDSSGDVWVLDSYNYRVEEFSATGGPLTRFGSQGSASGQLSLAHGLAISGGNLYVSEFANNRVQEFSVTGTFIAQFGTNGSGNGQLRGPWGIASDPTTGNLYVADLANNRIEEFSSAGTFIATFGTAGSGAGQLSAPKGVAVNSTGNFFVADTANNRLEEWLATP